MFYPKKAKVNNQTLGKFSQNYRKYPTSIKSKYIKTFHSSVREAVGPKTF